MRHLKKKITNTKLPNKEIRTMQLYNTVFTSELILIRFRVGQNSKTDFLSVVEHIRFRSLTLGSHEGNSVLLLLLPPCFRMGARPLPKRQRCQGLA